jgi:23S rRNA (cytidine1920-2'-O)/16S rRNA (cytidine1409-2'-O)-methyltransferase
VGTRREEARLDERLLAEGLAESRARAQALIRTGRVLVDDVPVEKPGTRVPPGSVVRVRGADRTYVSRGGEKLAGALADLGIEVCGRACLDVGASTGGFTDCLLRAGARSVVAVDVGYGQLDARLRRDARVVVLERRNARDLRREDVPGAIDLVTIDVSFISATKILPVLPEVAPGADVLVLVKPQFEVGRAEVGKGGVVRDEALRQRAVEAVRACAEELGYGDRGRAESRLPGPKGNREVFLWLQPLTPRP